MPVHIREWHSGEGVGNVRVDTCKTLLQLSDNNAVFWSCGSGMDYLFKETIFCLYGVAVWASSPRCLNRGTGTRSACNFLGGHSWNFPFSDTKAG